MGSKAEVKDVEARSIEGLISQRNNMQNHQLRRKTRDRYWSFEEGEKLCNSYLERE